MAKTQLLAALASVLILAACNSSSSASADAPAEGLSISGCYRWFNGGVVQVFPDGTAIAVGTKVTATWSSDGGDQYTFTWSNGYVDHLTLSDAGLRGTNELGVSVSGAPISCTTDDAGADTTPADSGPAETIVDCLHDFQFADGSYACCSKKSATVAGHEICVGSTATGAACAGDDECTSGKCTGGACACNPSFGCLADGDCCDGGRCVDTFCKPCGKFGQACGNGCCGHLVCGAASGQCEGAPPGNACATNDDCYSGTCTAGKCACIPFGQLETCRTRSDCCTGECAPFGVSGAYTFCVSGQIGQACKSDAECVNGTCKGGLCTCLSPGTTCKGSDPATQSNGCCPAFDKGFCDTTGKCAACSRSGYGCDSVADCCDTAASCIVKPGESSKSCCVPRCSPGQCGPDPCGLVSCGGCPGASICEVWGVVPYATCCDPAKACAGAVCGQNACRTGSCGTCPSGQNCDGGKCVCAPKCAGRVCGDDGCGGRCGSCPAGKTCNASGQCVSGTCTPSCAGHNCGTDGCTGSCGTCPTGQSCNSGVCSGASSGCTYLTGPGTPNCVAVNVYATTSSCTTGVSYDVANNCGQPVYCRFCPEVGGVVDESRCEAFQPNGSNVGQYFCGSVSQVRWLCAKASDPPTCVRF